MNLREKEQEDAKENQIVSTAPTLMNTPQQTSHKMLSFPINFPIQSPPQPFLTNLRLNGTISPIVQENQLKLDLAPFENQYFQIIQEAEGDLIRKRFDFFFNFNSF